MQFYKCAEILESFYNDSKLPINSDLKGNLYILNSNANNMNRSTVRYYLNILSDKRAGIKKANNSINIDQDNILYDTARLLVVNKDCEIKLIALCGGEENPIYTPMIQEKLTYEVSHKCSAMLLNAFIRVRILKNLTDTYNMPNKGGPAKVLPGLIYKKVKGPFMIALAYQNRSKPIIGMVHILQPIQTPPMCI